MDDEEENPAMAEEEATYPEPIREDDDDEPEADEDDNEAEGERDDGID